MLSPCRVPSHTRPVFHARRNTAYGTQHSAGNTPYVLSCIPIADRKVNVCMCKNDEFYESFIVVWKKLDAVQR